MCYALLLSTTSTADLSRHNSELIAFERDLPDLEDSTKLSHRNRWHVASREGCSCGFRHLYSSELGFGEPVAWYPENALDLAATKVFVGIVRQLVENDHAVDCLDVWWGSSNLPYVEMLVDLSRIRDEQFRLFENHKFIFAAGGVLPGR